MSDDRGDLDDEIERAAAGQGLDSADPEDDEARDEAGDRAAVEEMRAIEDEQAEIANDRAVLARVNRLAGWLLERGKPRIH
jgi:hypothetical protein